MNKTPFLPLEFEEIRPSRLEVFVIGTDSETHGQFLTPDAVMKFLFTVLPRASLIRKH